MTASTLQDRDELATNVDSWLTAAGRGDQRAFDSLYQATSSMLLGVCMRVLGDRGGCVAGSLCHCLAQGGAIR
jgi:hypothetical protein